MTSSIWFNLSPLLKDPENPMRLLMQMAERYGPVIPVNMANQRVVLVTEPEYFKHVLVTKVDNYVKYFDGLKPIFGKSMITQRRRALAEDPHAAAARVPPRRVRRLHPLLHRGHQNEDGQLGRAREDPARRSRWSSRPGRLPPT